MIFPQEKKDLIKYLDKNARQLHWPDWITTVIRQLVTESDATEKCIAEMANRYNDQIAAHQVKLDECGWTLNMDGEWVKPLPGDPPPESPEETLECWM